MAEDDRPPPPYSEKAAINSLHRQNTQQRSEDTSSALLASILYDEIAPRLQAPGSSELSSATLVLIPSDVTSLQTSSSQDRKYISQENSGEKLVGFKSSQDPILVRLSDARNNLNFWRNKKACEGLRTLMRLFLQDVGYQVRWESSSAPATSQSSSGWRHSEQSSLHRDEASVTVEARNVCLRTENEVGLYEARNGLAVVVSVDIGDDDPSWKS